MIPFLIIYFHHFDDFDEVIKVLYLFADRNPHISGSDSSQES